MTCKVSGRQGPSDLSWPPRRRLKLEAPRLQRQVASWLPGCCRLGNSGTSKIAHKTLRGGNKNYNNNNQITSSIQSHHYRRMLANDNSTRRPETRSIMQAEITTDDDNQNYYNNNRKTTTSRQPNRKPSSLSQRIKKVSLAPGWRLVRWTLVHLCLPLFIVLQILAPIQPTGGSTHGLSATASATSPTSRNQEAIHFQYLRPAKQTPREDPKDADEPRRRRETRNRRQTAAALPWASIGPLGVGGGGVQSSKRHLAMLMPSASNELRVSGSKFEPPSRPSVDWSKQRPYFGTEIQRNVSVELGKTALLACKVFELGDKTVSWLRPRENEILTAGRYTYIGDPRFASINEPGSSDWILEIKEVTLNDSTSYECQVSTDPKMSTIINLNVKAARARIKQGEQYYASVGANIEFTCDLVAPSRQQQQPSQPTGGLGGAHQTYWYHNGNLLNYAKTSSEYSLKSFDIEWDPHSQTSRLKLSGLSLSDSGNYTCKPTSAEPATIRLHIKRSKNASRDRTHYSPTTSYHMANTKEAQRTRQNYGPDQLASPESAADSNSGQANNNFTERLSLVMTLISFAYIQILQRSQQPSAI